jgi:hypothetical protein
MLQIVGFEVLMAVTLKSTFGLLGCDAVIKKGSK